MFSFNFIRCIIFLLTELGNLNDIILNRNNSSNNKDRKTYVTSEESNRE